MSHARAARPAFIFWSLMSIFFVALLWVGVVPKAWAGTPAESAGAIQVRATGDFRRTLEEARASAILAAQRELASVLRQFDPPVDRVPDEAVIRDKMVTGWGAPEPSTALHPDDVYHRLTVDVSLRPEHVRSLRNEERIVETAWVIGGATLLLAVVALFLRVEEWTKGFLTRWLILGAVGVAALIAVLWWVIKT
jgi:hypothetical protein